MLSSSSSSLLSKIPGKTSQADLLPVSINNINKNLSNSSSSGSSNSSSSSSSSSSSEESSDCASSNSSTEQTDKNPQKTTSNSIFSKMWDMMSISDGSAASSDSKLGVLSLSKHSRSSSSVPAKSQRKSHTTQRKISANKYATLTSSTAKISPSSEQIVDYDQLEKGLKPSNHSRSLESSVAPPTAKRSNREVSNDSTNKQDQESFPTRSMTEDAHTGAAHQKDSVDPTVQPDKILVRQSKPSQEGLLSESTQSLLAWGMLFCGLILMGICALIFVIIEWRNMQDNDETASSVPVMAPTTGGAQGDIFVSPDQGT